MKITTFLALLAIAPLVHAQAPASTPPPAPIPVQIDWSRTTLTSRTTPTLQVVANPLLRRGNVVHDGAFAALHDLGADYVRCCPWIPYPRLAVAELEPPTPQKTSWDFSLIDPMMIDFFNATQGHPTVVNFSTIPQWMFVTPKPVTYPADPNQVTWKYGGGTELRDPSLKELADYYSRLVSWYTRGGFTDENGKVHTSGYHYSLPYWEFLNEIDSEHHTTPQQYTARYDAVVSAIHAVSPQTKFVGLALASAKRLAYYTYFLDPKNHKPGIPIDFISYHFYAIPKKTDTADQWQHGFFTQADGFLATVRKIEAIRQRLSPATRSDLDELGVINDIPNIPPIYWNAAGAMYAYLYVELTKLNIDVVGESQIVGYPSQFPSVSMIDWTNGKPNARFWVLKLLKDNFGPGGQLVATTYANTPTQDPDLDLQAFQTGTGRKLLLINKRNEPRTVQLPPEAANATLDAVDLSTGENPPRHEKLTGPTLTLTPFEVAVLHL
jgi:hypothetical protein